MWIEELKRELVGRPLDIWRGHDDAGKPIDLPPERQEVYRALWRNQANGVEVIPMPNGMTAPPNPGPCRYISDAPIDKQGCNCPQKWIYECEVYGACTPAIDRTDRTAVCAKCPFRKPRNDEEDVKFPEPLVLSNKLSPGDVLVMSAAIESLHKLYPGKYITAVESPAGAIWDHNPHVRRLHGPVRAKTRWIEMEYPLVHRSNHRPVHFLQGYCDFLGEKLGVPLPPQTNRPHLYLSDDEKGWTPQVQELTGRPTKYWVVNAGTKYDFTAKAWGPDNYQKVVDYFQGAITFVQVGEAHHNHPPLKGVIDLIGKTDTRQLIRLCYHAQGGLGPTTFLQHIFAALQKPYVCLLGGREPVSWTHYPTQVTMSAHGRLDCCRTESCWRSRTVKLNDNQPSDSSLCEQPVTTTEHPRPRCMQLIRPSAVADAIETFYAGGVLSH